MRRDLGSVVGGSAVAQGGVCVSEDKGWSVEQ